MSVDLNYKNKYGISLQDVLGVLIDKPISKKEIKTALSTETNIDLLLKKLEEVALVEKQKEGTKILYTVAVKAKTPEKKPVTRKKKVVDKQASAEEIKIDKDISSDLIEASVNTEVLVEQKSTQPFRKTSKANPTRTKTPIEVNKINKQTEAISEKHQISNLVEIEEKKTSTKHKTDELNENDLQALKREMETKLGKEVTAVLHKRNERVLKERKKTAQEIFEAEQKKLEEASENYDAENPFRFILNFFTTTINGEKATPYFRRRDEYVVKSIYNKFKTLCGVIEEYDLTIQNLPFYRVLSINVKDRTVKMYHVNLNRMVVGVHNLFKLTENDLKYIKF